jgi:hypothetical protein
VAKFPKLLPSDLHTNQRTVVASLDQVGGAVIVHVGHARCANGGEALCAVDTYQGDVTPS